MSQGSGPGGGAELHLLVIWSAGRPVAGRVLDDLGARFELRRVHELRWSPELVLQNYARFYRGRLVPPYRSVAPTKGTGPLLVVTVVDRSPRYETRETLHGPDRVNVRVFEAKKRHRRWAGGAEVVHGSDTAAEARRDLMLLLGYDPARYLAAHPGSWDGVIRPLKRNLTGAHGWDSPAQLFDALDASVHYMLLDRYEDRPGGPFADDRPVDLLTNAYRETVAVTNARPVLGVVPPAGGRFRLQVGGRSATLDLRFVGDQHLDPAWQRRALERRVRCDGGFFGPDPEDAFEILAYRALMHRGWAAAPNRARLVARAAALGRPGWTHAALDDPARARALLDAVLERRGYRRVRPRDVFVAYDFHAAGARWPTIRSALAALQPLAATWYHRGAGPLQAWLVTLRGRAFGIAPWLRRLMRRRPRRRAGLSFEPPPNVEGLDADSVLRP